MTRLALAGLGALLVLAGPAPGLHAQTAADSAAIRATALDYIEGWYAGDGDRMERALHPELVKRIVGTDRATGQPQLRQLTTPDLVRATRAGSGKTTPVARQEKDVRILDVFENAASVRVTASDWIDYMHLAKWNGRWLIINVLWELKPQA